MRKPRPSKDTKPAPAVFCRRQGKWLAMDEHLKCEFCAGPVFDQEGDPVSFLCTHDGEKREFQPPPPPPPYEEMGEGD